MRARIPIGKGLWPANATLEESPFDLPQHQKMNVSVGGNWGGAHGIDVAVFPQRMMVDYVRVNQWKDNPLPLLLLKPGKTRLNKNLFMGFSPTG